ncbi:alpha/beta hydrolase [Alkalimonas collagenimarina]|uniref:Alpha/beta hydrolase n=1 Tax=Alkalimonas collagenimarina TaxID=400390 RepID=A0ABT9H127_9GAMM|nr:alpha/beta hydrolase [Alkalimonas collagenimarina]MDP4537003.1 alpha/beta hydrolase [Alkalimonas collagenimarina]
MRTLITLLLYLVAGYVVICLLLYLLQRQLIYFPVPAAFPPDNPLILQQGEHQVLVSHRPRQSEQALLYFGGNAEDTSVSLSEFSAEFPEHAIYLMHYRGYAGSDGKPSEQALVSDALALFDQVSQQHSDIIVIGRSLGSGVAVQLAAQRPVQQLVLITPFDSLTALASQQFPLFPVRLLLKDRYDSARSAAKIHTPTLLLVAREDEIIGRERSEALYNAFPKGSVRMVHFNGNHNSYLPAHQLHDLIARPKHE